MEIRTTGGQLKPGAAFKLIATGYLLGAGAIFVPLFALITVALVVSGGPVTENGQVVEGGAFASLAMLIMVPFILCLQAMMVAALIVFGLWLYGKRRPIRVVEKPEG